MPNILKNFLNVFQSGGASAVGIDVGTSAIKAVQLKKRNGQAILETYGELALGPYAGIEVGRATHLPKEKIAEALADLLREANVTAKQAGMALPISASLVSVMDMPLLESSQFAQMVPIEARKYIPVPISEVTLDWSVIPRQEKEAPAGPLPSDAPKEAGPTRAPEKVSVLVVAIHNEALAAYQELAARSGLETSFFEIEVFGTIRGTMSQDLSPVLVIDWGAGSTKLFVIDQGVVRLSHALPQGFQNLTIAISRAMNVTIDQAEGLKRSFGLDLKKDGREMAQVMTGTLNYLLSEAHRVLVNYERHSGRPVSRVIMTGGGANLIGLVPLAKTVLPVPVEIADPFSRVGAPAFFENVLKSVGPEFSVALGVALRRLQEIS